MLCLMLRPARRGSRAAAAAAARRSFVMRLVVHRAATLLVDSWARSRPRPRARSPTVLSSSSLRRRVACSKQRSCRCRSAELAALLQRSLHGLRRCVCSGLLALVSSIRGLGYGVMLCSQLQCQAARIFGSRDAGRRSPLVWFAYTAYLTARRRSQRTSSSVWCSSL